MVAEAQFGNGQCRAVIMDSIVLKIRVCGQPDNTPDSIRVQPPFGAGSKFFSGVPGDWKQR
ncbi:MAG: hypothetical protein OEU91_10445 [Gammaproteobacteria bacterium]|nr:hypothetical protein [Gammaproteobacteria bacterium]